LKTLKEIDALNGISKMMLNEQINQPVSIIKGSMSEPITNTHED